MQQIAQHRAVGDIGRRRHHRVDQLAAAVDLEMRLHPEISPVALLGLMHLGIAGPCRHSWSRAVRADRALLSEAGQWPPAGPGGADAAPLFLAARLLDSSLPERPRAANRWALYGVVRLSLTPLRL
jgi:hypothetical protein